MVFGAVTGRWELSATCENPAKSSPGAVLRESCDSPSRVSFARSLRAPRLKAPFCSSQLQTRMAREPGTPSGKMPFTRRICSESNGPIGRRWAVVLCSLTSIGQKFPDSEQRTARHFEAIRKQPPLLLTFLRDMPKGGDLHNHLFGAILRGIHDRFCRQRRLLRGPHDFAIDRAGPATMPATTSRASRLFPAPTRTMSCTTPLSTPGPCATGPAKSPATIISSPSFDKFQMALFGRIGDAFAETSSRAAADHLQYLELMHTADGLQSANLGAKIGWDDNLARFREKLAGWRTEGSHRQPLVSKLDRDESRKRQILLWRFSPPPLPAAPSRSATSIKFCAVSPGSRCSHKPARLRIGTSRSPLCWREPGSAGRLVRSDA